MIPNLTYGILYLILKVSILSAGLLSEVDEECDETTSLSSTLPTDMTHEEEHEEDHHEQFSEEYIRQHDGGDRAEFLEELNEKHDPPFYVPPTNS
jgi:hypothetical protein